MAVKTSIFDNCPVCGESLEMQLPAEDCFGLSAEKGELLNYSSGDHSIEFEPCHHCKSEGKSIFGITRNGYFVGFSIDPEKDIHKLPSYEKTALDRAVEFYEKELGSGKTKDLAFKAAMDEYSTLFEEEIEKVYPSRHIS